MVSVFMHGFTVGASLIIAIGAQNAFVLAQGIKKKHVFIIPAVSTMFDFGLIMIGVSGTGTLVASSPQLQIFMAWVGGIFLACYGTMALWDALKGKSVQESQDENGQKNLWNILLTLTGLTFLNPHVYLDTIVLIGSMSGQNEGNGKYMFGIGAGCASMVWFFSLSLFGVVIGPLFKKQITWKILNVFVAVTMYAIAYKLVT